LDQKPLQPLRACCAQGKLCEAILLLCHLLFRSAAWSPSDNKVVIVPGQSPFIPIVVSSTQRHKYSVAGMCLLRATSLGDPDCGLENKRYKFIPSCTYTTSSFSAWGFVSEFCCVPAVLLVCLVISFVQAEIVLTRNSQIFCKRKDIPNLFPASCIQPWPQHTSTMLYCILLITSRLLLPSVDGLQVDNPPSTAPPASPPPSSSPPDTITEPPSTAALIAVYPRLFLPSTGKPEEGCTHTKRVPSSKSLHHHSNPPAIDTTTSYVNCKGCNAVTTIPIQHTPDLRAAGPAQMRPTATGSGATTPAITSTATVYRCSETPSPTESSRTIPPPPPRGISSRRTRPVQPTLLES
jgi:hypothetical protein